VSGATTYQGDAYGTYGWACDVVELEVDRDTCEVRPIAFTTVHEIGKAIHPRLAAGQIEGGSAQGLGYALLEEVVMRDGRMANSQLTNYIIPTTLDTPPLEVVMLENPYKHGPFARRDRRDADRWSGAGGGPRCGMSDSMCGRCRRRPSESWRRRF
jgi:CO/xanthine dehydrogenase Mo-binding subunit